MFGTKIISRWLQVVAQATFCKQPEMIIVVRDMLKSKYNEALDCTCVYTHRAAMAKASTNVFSRAGKS